MHLSSRFFIEKTESRMLYADWWRPTTSWRNFRSDTRCWERRPSMQKCKQHPLILWTLCAGNARYTEKERERHKVVIIQDISTVTITIATTLTKGYKVTLYSDWLRAITLYNIYRNVLNLGCPRDNVNTAIIHSYSTHMLCILKIFFKVHVHVSIYTYTHTHTYTRAHLHIHNKTLVFHPHNILNLCTSRTVTDGTLVGQCIARRSHMLWSLSLFARTFFFLKMTCSISIKKKRQKATKCTIRECYIQKIWSGQGPEVMIFRDQSLRGDRKQRQLPP